MTTRLRPHRWVPSAAAALVLSALMALTRDDWVVLPVLQERLPVRLVLLVVAVPVVLTPLYGRFPELTVTFPRERSVRVGQVVGYALLIAVVLLPALGAADGALHADVGLVLLLLALGAAAVVVVGDAAWLVPLVAGVTVLFVDTSGSAPVTRALAGLPLAIPCAAVLAACVLYVTHGPRRGRSGDDADG